MYGYGAGVYAIGPLGMRVEQTLMEGVAIGTPLIVMIPIMGAFIRTLTLTSAPTLTPSSKLRISMHFVMRNLASIHFYNTAAARLDRSTNTHFSFALVLPSALISSPTPSLTREQGHERGCDGCDEAWAAHHTCSLQGGPNPSPGQVCPVPLTLTLTLTLALTESAQCP